MKTICKLYNWSLNHKYYMKISSIIWMPPWRLMIYTGLFSEILFVVSYLRPGGSNVGHLPLLYSDLYTKEYLVILLLHTGLQEALLLKSGEGKNRSMIMWTLSGEAVLILTSGFCHRGKVFRLTQKMISLPLKDKRLFS